MSVLYICEKVEQYEHVNDNDCNKIEVKILSYTCLLYARRKLKLVTLGEYLKVRCSTLQHVKYKNTRETSKIWNIFEIDCAINIATIMLVLTTPITATKVYYSFTEVTKPFRWPQQREQRTQSTFQTQQGCRVCDP